jgi:hypothetical protein
MLGWSVWEYSGIVFLAMIVVVPLLLSGLKKNTTHPPNRVLPLFPRNLRIGVRNDSSKHASLNNWFNASPINSEKA